MTEAELMAAIRKAATAAGWLSYHTHDSRRSPQGFPDLLLVHPHRRDLPAYALELKRATGKPTAAQRVWLDALSGRTIEAALVRPCDLAAVLAWLREAP